MYLVAKHAISDPERFWGAVRAAGTPPAAGPKLHGTYPNRDGTEAVCLWEAESIDAVKAAVEAVVGDSSRNEFFEVDPARAVGLPSQAHR